MEKDKTKKAPNLQDVKAHMEASGAYTGIFPEMFKLLNIVLALPVGTASVKRSFSYMKLMKTRLRNRLSDVNLARLMRIAKAQNLLRLQNFGYKTSMKFLKFLKRKIGESSCRVVYISSV